MKCGRHFRQSVDTYKCNPIAPKEALGNTETSDSILLFVRGKIVKWLSPSTQSCHHFYNNFTHYNKINTLALSAEPLVEGWGSSCETPMEVDGAVW